MQLGQLFQDSNMFFVFEGLILCLFLAGYIKDMINKRSGKVVKRGPKSIRMLKEFPSIIIGIGLIDVTINTAGEYKIIFSILNGAVLIYLVYFNSWFRNRIIGWNIKAFEKAEHV